MRVLCEHALSATDVNAIGCAHGTAHRVAYSSPNSAADSDAERGAHNSADRVTHNNAERDPLCSSDEHANLHSHVVPII